MASITIAFDAGTSGSKVIASYPSGECVFNDEDYFLVKPAVRSLTPETYQNLLEYVEGSVGLNSNLVSYIDPGSGELVYWEVGESASRPGQLSVNERKFETLLVKVLAFLGYLVKTTVKTSERVKLSLGILLPLDEIEDRAILAKWLRVIIAAQGFTVNGHEIKNIDVERINCKPEGYGIYKSYPSPQAGILMLGHSDLSWLYFNQGAFVVEQSRTFPGSGMHSFIKSTKFPTGYELLTAEIIAKAGSKLNPEILAELTQTKSNDEIAYLIKGIKSAHPQYWIERRKEFKSLEIKWVDSICAAGGAANYFANELNQVFKETYGIKLNWCKSLGQEFSKHFALKASEKSKLSLFLDCYGYYKTLVAKEQIKVVPKQMKREKGERVLEVVQSATK